MATRFPNTIAAACRRPSPALAWSAPPDGTVELLLVVQEPDVPVKKPATHALAAGIDPSLHAIPENGLTDPAQSPGLRHGKGGLGRRGWSGPLPPRSRGRRTPSPSSSSRSISDPIWLTPSPWTTRNRR